MKRIVLALVFASLLLAGCRKTNDAECASAWRQMDVAAGDEGMIINLIMNNNHAPDTVGAYLRQCLEEGYRPPGM